jgi:hypothetical protein
MNPRAGGGKATPEVKIAALVRFAVALRLADSPALHREADQPIPNSKPARILSNLNQDLTSQA